MRSLVIDQAREQLSDNENVALVLEKAEKDETLKFWESKLPEILGPELARGLVVQAKASKRMRPN